MDLGSTAEEIAGAHYVSVDTLDRRLRENTGCSFAELKKQCCGTSKIKLRNNQFKMSEKSAAMAIWLGKQWIGQLDVPREIEEFNGNLSELLTLMKNMKQVPETE